MGIFDFLGDISSKRSKELGLGGLQSLLGTRGAAQAGATGDEMMKITGSDSLPGYYNEQTREYVPWYVDLFDGGGLNAAGGQTQEEAAKSSAASVTPGGAPMQSPGLLQTGAGQSPLEPFGGAGPTIPEGPLGPFGGAGPAMQDTPDTSYYTPPSSMQMPAQQASALQQAAQVGSQVIPSSGGNMAINTPAAQNRDQMISDQQALVREQEIKSHPLYPEYVDFLNQSGLASVPGLFERYLKVTGAN